MYFKQFFISVATFLSFSCYAQVGNTLDYTPNPVREAMFLPYLAVRHGGTPVIEEWKKNNTVQYYKELWYYTESFYVRRDYLSKGEPLNESIIDISRFENSRKSDDEAIVILPGFKDVLVLQPLNKLLYYPKTE
jgi:hypothetical protein